MKTLSENAITLYEMMKEEYINNGFSFDGMLPINFIIALFGESVHQKEIYGAVTELKEASIIQQRKCDGDAYELTQVEQMSLILQHNLPEVWQGKYKINH